MNMFDLCVHFNGVLTNEECDEMIEIYEHNIKDSRSNQVYHSDTYNYDGSNWHEFNLIKKPFGPEFDAKIQKMNELAFQQYKDRFSDHNFFTFPKEYHFNGARIKKYETGGNDQFKWHADQNGFEVSDRFLVFLYYLNDVEEGGETAIATVDGSSIMIKPKKGSLLVFPPYWMFTHCGLPPISNPKYIISSYGRIR